MRPTEDTAAARLQADPAAVQAYRDSRFGLFVHWGVYALIGHGEWVMHTEKIPTPEYEKLPPRFNPAQFSAEEWGDLMLASGQKYMVITSKHHDGFAMFHSKADPFNIVDATPFKHDPMKELAEACAKAGKHFAIGTGTTPTRTVGVTLALPIVGGAVSLDLKRPDFAFGDTVIGTIHATITVPDLGNISAQTVQMGGAIVAVVTNVRR